jgi:hypothetical protein
MCQFKPLKRRVVPLPWILFWSKGEASKFQKAIQFKGESSIKFLAQKWAKFDLFQIPSFELVERLWNWGNRLQKCRESSQLEKFVKLFFV